MNSALLLESALAPRASPAWPLVAAVAGQRRPNPAVPLPHPALHAPGGHVCLPPCDGTEEDTGDCRPEWRSRFLRGGRALARTRLRGGRHHAQALAAGLRFSRGGQVLRAAGGC